MPRDYAVEAQRAKVLRDELARTRARLDQVLGERDDLAMRLDKLLGYLVRQRVLSASAARWLLDDACRPPAPGLRLERKAGGW